MICVANSTVRLQISNLFNNIGNSRWKTHSINVEITFKRCAPSKHTNNVMCILGTKDKRSFVKVRGKR